MGRARSSAYSPTQPTALAMAGHAGRRPLAGVRWRLVAPQKKVSQNVAAEVLVGDQIAEAITHKGGVHGHGLARALAGGEGDLFEQLLHDRMQPSRADVFDPLVHLLSIAGQLGDPILGE